jgi:hypothetical protein
LAAGSVLSEPQLWLLSESGADESAIARAYEAARAFRLATLQSCEECGPELGQSHSSMSPVDPARFKAPESCGKLAKNHVPEDQSAFRRTDAPDIAPRSCRRERAGYTNSNSMALAPKQSRAAAESSSGRATTRISIRHIRPSFRCSARCRTKPWLTARLSPWTNRVADQPIAACVQTSFAGISG